MALPAALLAQLGTSALAAAPEAMKMIKGFQQKKAAGKIKPGERLISDKRKRYAKDLAGRAASPEFAGQKKLEERLEQTSADVMAKAKDVASPDEYLSVASREGDQQRKARLEIGEKAAASKEAREEKAGLAKKEIGALEENISDERRLEQIQAKKELGGAADQNIYSGIKGAAGVASTMVGKGLFGKKPVPGADKMTANLNPGTEKTGSLVTPGATTTETAEQKRRRLDEEAMERLKLNNPERFR